VTRTRPNSRRSLGGPREETPHARSPFGQPMAPYVSYRTDIAKAIRSVVITALTGDSRICHECCLGVEVLSGDLYNAQGDRIGHVDFSGGRVTDRYDRNIGKVMTYGSGTIEDAEGWSRGEVSMSGRVDDNEGRTVGRVSGTTVYDNSGYTVGSVDAQTRTTWVTGITDAHKAGGALLLLILKKGN